ncbi:MAG: hypothetical protein NVS1B3_01100 [Candidatus Dormibacteraceae bacterium]
MSGSGTKPLKIRPTSEMADPNLAIGFSVIWGLALLVLGLRLGANPGVTVPLLALYTAAGLWAARLLHRWRIHTSAQIDEGALILTGSSGRRLTLVVDRIKRSAVRRVEFGGGRLPSIWRTYYLIGTDAAWIWAFDLDEWRREDLASLGTRLGQPLNRDKPSDHDSIPFTRIGIKYPGVAEWWRAPASFQLGGLVVFAGLSAFVGILLVFGPAFYAR